MVSLLFIIFSNWFKEIFACENLLLAVFSPIIFSPTEKKNEKCSQWLGSVVSNIKFQSLVEKELTCLGLDLFVFFLAQLG